MSVRPTQTKSGYPRRAREPFPSSDQDLPTEPGPESDTPPVDPAQPAPAGAVSPTPSRVDRRTRRAARRSQRNLAIACGLLVAVCLILTILIVNMARTRPLGLAPATVLTAQGTEPVAAYGSTVPVRQIPDAPASEGGTR